jgi:hypothetical protein
MGEFIWKLIKKALVNITKIHQVLSCKKERILFIIILIIASIPIIKYRPPLIISLWFLTSYFWIKAFLQQIREEFYNNIKYKSIKNILGKEVTITKVINNEIHLNSMKTFDTIRSYVGMMQHVMNKKIEGVYQDEHNFRHIIIKLQDGKKKKKKSKEFYFLKDYIDKAITKGMTIPFLVGLDENGKIVVLDLDEIGTMIIAAVQKGGKSSFINTIIQSLMMYNNNLFFCISDFKRVELVFYKDFDHVAFCDNAKDLVTMLQNLVDIMLQRYETISGDCTSVAQYNEEHPDKQMPPIVFIGDEFSDPKLCGEDEDTVKKIDKLTFKLLSQGRAASIYFIAATWRPDSVSITSQIKSLLKCICSGRAINPETQRVIGIKGTENLKPGEFIIKDDNGERWCKVFYTCFKKAPEVYNYLKSQKEAS